MNVHLAEKVLKSCQDTGVHEYCICAGARNSPLVLALSKAKGVRLFHFFEERSAAFFALGRIKDKQMPVAVVTTSGTAVAELLPAAIEATYSGLALILISADRPRRYRNTGAPQSIQQMGLFSHYVEKTVDIEDTDENIDIEMWTGRMPLHINVCFDEPLIDAEISEMDLTPAVSKSFSRISSQQKRKIDKPLVVLGGLNKIEKEKVTNFLKSIRAPIYAESHSNLLGEESLNLISEKTVNTLISEGRAKSVLRIGGVPTLRLWRDLEEKYKTIPVFSCSDLEFPGLSRPVKHVVGYDQLECFEVLNWQMNELQQIAEVENSNQLKLDLLIGRYPESEVALLATLAKKLSGQNIYLGNSLPIRQWDLVAPKKQRFTQVEANRGANGIDGQLSTFLGLSEQSCESWGIFGDLTTMYDLSAPWITSQLFESKKRIVVVNNQGGQIFKNIFNDKIFLNEHQINFSNWAQMWSWDYEKWVKIPSEVLNHKSNKLVIELCPEKEQTEKFWLEYK